MLIDIAKKREDMEEKYYSTFHVKSRDGKDIEMAVVDEFQYDNKHYIVGSIVENDTILDDGQYIYRCTVTEDGFSVSEIKNEFEFEHISKAYMEMDE